MDSHHEHTDSCYGSYTNRIREWFRRLGGLDAIGQLCFTIVVVFSLFTIKVYGSEEGIPAAIEVLLLENERSRLALANVAVTYSEKYKSKSTVNPVNTFSRVERIEKMGKIRVVRADSFLTPEGQSRKDAETRIVVNDSYAAFWTKGTKNANRVDHRSIEAPRRQMKTMIDGSPNPLDNGFQVNGLSLRERISHAPSKWRLTTEIENDGKSFYVLSNIENGNGVKCTIDPSMGFLITEFQFIRSNEVVELIRVVPSVDENGNWYPGMVSHEWFTTLNTLANGVEDSPSAMRSIIIQIGDIVFDPMVGDEVFEVEGLGLRNGVHLIRRHLDDSVTSEVLVDSRFVDVDIIRMLMAEENRIQSLNTMDEQASLPDDESDENIRSVLDIALHRKVEISVDQRSRSVWRILGGIALTMAILAVVCRYRSIVKYLTYRKEL